MRSLTASAVLLLILAACSSDARLGRIEAKLAHVDSVESRLPVDILLAAPATSYVLSDIARDGKNVAHFTTTTPIAQDDRVFVGDDMWDVKYAKVFAAQADTAGGTSVNYVQLLVTYGVKAKDPKSGG